MPSYLHLKDLYEIVLTDMDNLTESSTLHGGKLSDILNQKLTPLYKGLRCFFCKYEHGYKYFLSEIEGVSFDISPNGLRLCVKFKEDGRFAGHGKTFDELLEDKISRKNLKSLLAKKLKKIKDYTLPNGPETEIKSVFERTIYSNRMYLIQDGQSFLKADS